jgi:predicted MFS family arabinose efflux permease
MLAVLRRRDFALLWTGGLVSVAGDWVLNAALPFFVYERTGSTVATAGMIVAELAPGVVVGSFSGVYVDRVDRRRLLVVADLLQALVASALLLVAAGGGVAVVYVVAAAQSAIAAFSVPAESALLPSLVPQADLVAANALNTLNNRIARLAGVPLGGLLLGFGGLTSVVLVDVASFAAAAVLVALVRPPAQAPVARERFRGEWLEGLSVVRRDPAVAMVFWVLGLMTFGGTMLDPLYVAWVRDVLGGSPQVYAFLLATHAVAGIGGAVLVGRLRVHLAPRTLMGWSSVVAGLALALKFALPLVALTFALTVVGGVVSVASAVGVETWAQSAVPDRLRGRVFAALGASGALFSLAGAAVGGVAARYVGVTAMLEVAASLVALAGMVVLRAVPAWKNPARVADRDPSPRPALRGSRRCGAAAGRGRNARTDVRGRGAGDDRGRGR